MANTENISSRLEKWMKQIEKQVFIEEDGIPVGKVSSENGNGVSVNAIWELTNEVIFDVIDDKPVFHHICPVVNVPNHTIAYRHFFTFYPADKLEQTRSEAIVEHIGLASAVGIPVYPNSAQLEESLADYYETLLMDGFVVPDKEGNRKWYRPTNSKSISDFSSVNLASLDFSLPWTPVDLSLLKKKILIDIERFGAAQRVLLKLTVAIDQLKELLSSPEKESQLQRCLWDNPILFGLEYLETIQQYKLGSEYIADFALVKYSGLTDLVEIEPSTFSLYSKKGDPTSYLIHAEQQAIDWLDWIEHHGPYARNHLAGLFSPTVFIIIGRQANLSQKDQKSLQRRNLLFRGTVQIFTYDALVERAQGILTILQSKESD